MIRFKAFFLVVFLFISIFCFGQISRLGVFKSEISNIKFSISDEQNLKIRNGLYFAEYYPEDKVIVKGNQILKKQKITDSGFPIDNSVYCWHKRFVKPLVFRQESTLMYQRIFAQNISKYEVYFRSAVNDHWYKKSYEIVVSKYQVPIIESISDWVYTDKTNSSSIQNKNVQQLLSKNNEEVFIREMAIVVYPIKGFRESDFIVGDFQIYDHRESFTADINHPFFLKYNGKGYKVKHEIKNEKGDIELLETFVNNSFPRNTLELTFEGVDTLSDIIQRNSIIKLFDLIFSQYPYYPQYGVNRNSIKQKYDSLKTAKHLSVLELLSGIKSLVNEFNDPHFSLTPISLPSINRNRTKQTVTYSRGPIRLHDLYEDIYVAAVLDTVSVNKLKPGMEVIAVDSRHIDVLVDSLSERFGGNKNVKRKKAISSLLIRPIDQECTITAISESDTIVEKLKYNKSFKMPSNFNNRSYMFKQINKQTAYLRIPSWNLVNYLFFLNNKDTFEHLENVIIDLRGNSGGWECEAMRFASLFIDKPCVYSTISFPWDQSNVIKETSVVNSAPKSINLSKVSVFILINGRTACASETFCDFMRSNTDAILIGNEKSSGALSFGHKIKLPNNYFLTTTLSTSIETATQNVIEYQGIAPDVWVSLAEINDLAPYGDKVLKTALLMVSSTTKKTRFEL